MHCREEDGEKMQVEDGERWFSILGLIDQDDLHVDEGALLDPKWNEGLTKLLGRWSDE